MRKVARRWLRAVPVSQKDDGTPKKPRSLNRMIVNQPEAVATERTRRLSQLRSVDALRSADKHCPTVPTVKTGRAPARFGQGVF